MLIIANCPYRNISLSSCLQNCVFYTKEETNMAVYFTNIHLFNYKSLLPVLNILWSPKSEHIIVCTSQSIEFLNIYTQEIDFQFCEGGIISGYYLSRILIVEKKYEIIRYLPDGTWNSILKDRFKVFNNGKLLIISQDDIISIVDKDMDVLYRFQKERFKNFIVYKNKFYFQYEGEIVGPDLRFKLNGGCDKFAIQSKIIVILYKGTLTVFYKYRSNATLKIKKATDFALYGKDGLIYKSIPGNCIQYLNLTNLYIKYKEKINKIEEDKYDQSQSENEEPKY